jgi:hypothetical protein
MMPNPQVTPVLDAALEYLDLGFSVIPVGHDKKPLIKWKEFQSRRPSADEIEDWFVQWPEANIAIVCGKISGIFCVDADGPSGIEWMNIYLPKTTVYSITAKGLHAIYLIPPNSVIRNFVRLAPEVDIRGEGGYFVAPPSIHESGHVYRWQFDLNGWDDIVEYRPPVSQIPQQGIDLSAVKTQPTGEGVQKGARNNTLSQLVGKWIHIGLDPDEIWTLAQSWNQNNDPVLSESELKKTVDSIHVTNQRNHPSHTPIQIAELPDLTELPTQNIPADLLYPDGLLSDLMEYIDQSTACSHPIFNLAGAISVIGTLVGQKFQTETGLRTNFYCIVLGYAGSGKDAPQQALQNLLMRSKAYHVCGPNTMTSDAAILRYLQHPEKARCVLFLDEIGLLLKGIRNERSAAREVPAMLMQLFSSVNRPFQKPYASQDNLIIKWHHLSFYGASTPLRFWENFTSTEASDGFLPRLLVFESHHKREPIRKHASIVIPDGLLEQVNNLAEIQPEVSGGNLEAIPIPKVIPKTKDAENLFHGFEMDMIRIQNDLQDKSDAAAALYGRVCEHAHKLALIHAVSVQGANVVDVGVESVRWAIDMMTALTDHTLSQIKENICDNQYHKYQQNILKAIRTVATPERPGASFREIAKRIRASRKQIEDLIDSMLATEEIVQSSYVPAHGPSTILYCANYGYGNVPTKNETL